MSVKLLTEHNLEFLSFKRDCTGSSESTLVKMPHCWKSHVTAQILVHNKNVPCILIDRKESHFIYRMNKALKISCDSSVVDSQKVSNLTLLLRNMCHIQS